MEGLQLSGLGVNAFNRAAELFTHQPVLPKPLGALGWNWRGGRALPAAGGVVGFSLPNTRTEKSNLSLMQVNALWRVRAVGICCWCRAWPGALGREAAGESAAPWLVSAQLSEEMGVGGCRAVLEPSVCPCWENRALVSQMTRKQK